MVNQSKHKRAATTQSSKSSIKKQKTQATASTAETLVDAHHDDCNQAYKPKGKQSFDAWIDEKVRHAIRDNLADLVEEDLDVVKVNGLTGRQRLKEAKMMQFHADKKKRIKVGKIFYMNFRAMYAVSTNVTTPLAPEEDVVDDNPWVEAVNESRAAVPNRKPLLKMLGGDVVPTQSEWCGVLGHALELKPYASGSVLPVLIKLCEFIVAHNLNTRYAKEFRNFERQYDRILSQVLVDMLNAGLSANDFYVKYRNLVALVVPLASCDILFGLSKDAQITEHGDHVDACCKSLAGKQLWGWALEAVVNGRLANLISVEIKQHFDGQAITAERVKACRTSIDRKIAELPIDPRNEPSTFLACFLGIEFPVQTESIEDHVDKAIHLYLTEAGLSHTPADSNAPLVAPLFNDVTLAEWRTSRAQPIGDGVLRDITGARSAAAKLVMPVGANRGEMVVDVLDKKQDAIKLIDSAFGATRDFFAFMYNGAGEKILLPVLLSKFPNTPNGTTAKTVQQQVEVIQKTPLYQFVKKEDSAVVSVSHGIVKAIASETLPNLRSCDGDSFLTKVKDRLRWLCYVNKPAGSEAVAETLYGKDAVLYEYEAMNDVIADAGEVAVSKMRWLGTWKFLLEAAQQEKFDSWMQDRYKKAGSVAQSSGVSRTNKKTTPGPAATAVTVDLAKKQKESTMSLFKKK